MRFKAKLYNFQSGQTIYIIVGSSYFSGYLYRKVLQAWAEACGITCICNQQTTALQHSAIKQINTRRVAAKVVTTTIKYVTNSAIIMMHLTVGK
tara:strand:+ start:2908 stop:3189 length:282 start_codon:yes stop_codon:yes gene_type:complete